MKIEKEIRKIEKKLQQIETGKFSDTDEKIQELKNRLSLLKIKHL